LLNYSKVFFFSVLIFVFSIGASGQCTLTISTFPYNESFETSPGGWFSGGTGNDWALGTPSKPVITTAANGSKCWITGGLTTSFYNNGERSWVQSPCFDFTSLANPCVTFRIFWETEYQYDGGNFQYSLDDGNTWTNVGAYNEPVNCLNTNWYNYPSIINLSTLAVVRNGWCGSASPAPCSSVGANGSGGWRLASHCLQNLAGAQSVIFRFTFGAGTQCNSFDGLAFDDITIQEAPVINSLFSFSCLSSNTISFTDQSGNCASSWSWNFNDPGSGINNVATTQNPTHTFSSPGSYNVTFTASNGCGSSAPVVQTINIIGTTAITTDITCYGGNNGTATIQVAGNAAPYTYTWNTNPVQTGPTATGLSQGTYVYYVTGNNVCADTNSVTINQPLQINYNIALVNAHCGLNNGAASVAVNGGTSPYNYSWSSAAGNVAAVSNLAPGNYSVTITDFAGCSVTGNFSIIQPPSLNSFLTVQEATCGSNNGTASVTVTGGTLPYTFTWSPNVSNNNIANNLSGGNYFVTVTDSSGCVLNNNIQILQQPAVLLSTSHSPDTCSKHVGEAAVTVNGGTAPYNYSWSGSGFISPSLANLASGNYTVTVSDANGCTNSQTISISDFGKFTIDLGEDGTICTGNQMQLFPGNYQSYRWQDSSFDSILIINKPGIYSVTVTNAIGCSSSDTILIREECLDDVLLPNAFTPNGDGKNDFFFALGLNVTSFHLQIFDRWGEKIFETDDMAIPWDGTYKGRILQEDIFVWIMKFSIDKKSSRQKTGHVMLVK
jgi:gliding motility-associated-like protein